MSSPREPPKGGSGVLAPAGPQRRANCTCPSHTSCRSRQRCTNASTCAKMPVTSKDQKRRRAPGFAATAVTVSLYRRRQS